MTGMNAEVLRILYRGLGLVRRSATRIVSIRGSWDYAPSETEHGRAVAMTIAETSGQKVGLDVATWLAEPVDCWP